MSTVLRVSTRIYGIFEDIDGKTFIFRVNLGNLTPQSNRLGKMSNVLRDSTHIYGGFEDIDEKHSFLEQT